MQLFTLTNFYASDYLRVDIFNMLWLLLNHHQGYERAPLCVYMCVCVCVLVSIIAFESSTYASICI